MRQRQRLARLSRVWRSATLRFMTQAFVDDEFEHGKRSGKDLVRRFLNPPLLNTTWDTGRLRRLGRTLYLDGKPWLMRAVCYSRIAVGWDPDWFEPYGDFFTNDYSGIFERDIPLMAAAGVNTMRIYTLKFSKRHKQFFDMATPTTFQSSSVMNLRMERKVSSIRRKRWKRRNWNCENSCVRQSIRLSLDGLSVTS